MTRRQLPAYSPLSAAGLAASGLRTVTRGRSSSARLAAYLTERFAAAGALPTGSGTQALTLALRLAPGLRPDSSGSVALPAYSCYDIVTAAVGAGSRVHFYDIDPVSLVPDPASLRAALAHGPAAVVIGNLFGFPIDWTAVAAECSGAGALLVEDAAQGLGSSWDGREAGSFGDLTVMSFGRGKGWTGGAGGALLWRDRAGLGEGAALGEAALGAVEAAGGGARAAILAGAQWMLGRPATYGLITSLPGTGVGETSYKEPEPPRGIPAFCAEAVLAHARAAREAVSERRRWAADWRALLEAPGPAWPFEPCSPLDPQGSGSLRLPLVCGRGVDADAVAAAMADLGGARGYPRPLPSLPEASAIAVRPGEVPSGARKLASSLVTLPTHPLVAASDVEGLRARRKSFPALVGTH